MTGSLPPFRPSRAQIFRRTVAIGVAGLFAVAAFFGVESTPMVPTLELGVSGLSLPKLPRSLLRDDKQERLEAQPLTNVLRQKGYHECFPSDPIGLGPYAPYRTIYLGARMLIPQKGGHTQDLGFDVLVHFHGHEPVRKTLVQIARGVVFVGIDRGINSGPYSDAFRSPDRFVALRRSIEAALVRHTGDRRAHIRRLALTAWSAGYGAVNEILKFGDEGIDAVVLLDGLHANYDPATKHRGGVESVSGSYIAPILEFAKNSLRGEKIFIFTHSEVDPGSYPSTKLTADLIVSRLGLERRPAAPSGERFGLASSVDRSGLHIWGYRGGDELAHCSHIPHIARAVRDVLEPAWGTPAMDRDVPFNAAPRLGPAHGAQEPPPAVQTPEVNAAPQAPEVRPEPGTPLPEGDDAVERQPAEAEGDPTA
jgi:hypothetical protein